MTSGTRPGTISAQAGAACGFRGAEEEAMGYIVIARKYRPRTFDEVIGQDGAARTLKNAISTGRIGHAYLFAGPRGVGKTSMARILSTALNCEKGPTETPCGTCRSCADIHAGRDIDVLEIDGASNRGIDEIRAIRENATYSPSKSRFRIFIIDEVHMLTVQAFNALLKILEEPPAHVKFIFATTKPQNVPDTIRSRCQRYDFRPVPLARIKERLAAIAAAEGAEADKAALEAVARRSQGGMRDSQSLLDQLLSMGGRITLESVERLFGWVPLAEVRRMASVFASSDVRGALEAVDRIYEDGRDPGEFLLKLEEYLRDVLLLASSGGRMPIDAASAASERELAEHAALFGRDELIYAIQVVHRIRKELGMDLEGRILLEAAMVRLATLKDLPPAGGEGDSVGQEDADAAAKPGAAAPSAAPAAAAAPKPAAPPALEDARKAWPAVLARLKKSHTWASYIVDAQPVLLDESGLHLGFPADRALHRNQASRQDRKEEISKAFREIAGLDLRIMCVAIGGRAGDAFEGVSEDRADRTAPRARDTEEIPVIRTALKVFDGKIVPKDEVK